MGGAWPCPSIAQAGGFQDRERGSPHAGGHPQSSGLGCACPRLGLILPTGKTRLCALGQPRAALGTCPGKGDNQPVGTIPAVGRAGIARHGLDPARGQMAPRSPKLPIMPLIVPPRGSGWPGPAGACVPPRQRLWDLWLFLIAGSYFGGERLFSLPAANPVLLFNLTQLFPGAGRWAAPCPQYPEGSGVGGAGWEVPAWMGGSCTLCPTLPGPPVRPGLLGAGLGSGQQHHGATEGNVPRLGTSGARWELGTSSKDGDARGDGATVPGGPWGPGSAVELGLNWKQVLGTSQRREWGCRGRGVRPGAGDGGVSGVHIWQRRGGRKHRIGSPPRPMLGRHRVPGGHITARCCAAVSGASSPPRAPHPPGSSPCASSAGRAGGDLRGPPLLQPQLPEPRVCLLPLCHYHQLTPPHLLSHLSPAPHSLSSPGSCPPAPSPGGSCPPGRSSLLPGSLGQRGGQGGGSVGGHLLLFLPPTPASILRFPAAQGLGWPAPARHPTSPSTPGREKPGEPPAARPGAAGPRRWRRGGGMLTPTAGRR